MNAAARILWDVVYFRLRKLEMANLAGATSIALALALPLGEVAYRTLFAFVLNVLVYLNNDYADVSFDLSAPDKDRDKTRFLQEHMRAARGSQWLLLCVLGVMALAYPRDLLGALLLGGGVCYVYSGWLKRRPYVDVLSMMAWGVAMPLCGTPLDRELGWIMALQLGLFSGVFECVQVVRDEQDDRAEQVRTTAVVLGPVATLRLARVLMVLAAVYAGLLLQPVAGALALIALFLRRGDDVSLYWTRIKLCYGLSWLVMCAQVYFTQQSAGLWQSLSAAAAFG